MDRNSFLITDSIAKTVQLVRVGDLESAYNFASLVVWRVQQHGSWMTEFETAFIDKCLVKPRRKRRTN